MKYYLLIPLFLFSLFAIPCSLPGQDAPAAQHSSDPFSDHLPYSSTDSSHPYDPLADHLQEPDNFQVKFMNMLFVLALLIGFMILASWMLKRMMKTRVTQLNSSSIIKVLETRYLSPRSTLYLLDLQGKQLLIAESATGVTALTSLETLPEEDMPSGRQSLPPYLRDDSKK
ncbi:FliO/MopB family protein [Candidatus Protochlamydia phocaeensis]|uniref:FliO/MopB family protein n=1 Tax=Candidatus Protochlamydia phocaeensis TaxID=1414722 RepID=UPI0008388130|nr:flagellar biosynthetic protein FliO [Candidatus Protochlamydia phocaeensis]